MSTPILRGLLILALALGACALGYLIRGESTREADFLSEGKTEGARGLESLDPGAMQRLELRLHALEDKVRSLEQGGIATQPFEKAASPAARPGTGVIDSEIRDARWYLEQYVASFVDEPNGLEYYRLAVEAAARELVDPMLGHVLGSNTPAKLRESLIQIMGTKRFRDRPEIVSTLLPLVSDQTIPSTLEVLFRAISVIGNESVASELGLAVLGLSDDSARAAGLDVAVELAGMGANLLISQLYRRESKEPGRQQLLGFLMPDPLDTALETFELVPEDTRAVRLTAAETIGVFRSERARDFVQRWIRRERDEEVLRLLGVAAVMQSTVPSYDAMQAAGAPDTKDPAADSPTAWASQDPDGGPEWLILSYEPALPAAQIRIFEVCSAGAVVEIHGTDVHGNTRRLWSGQDPLRSAGVFDVPVDAAETPIKSLRIVLDTERSAGWNEIDAVEIVGPRGRAFAVHASASTSYGQSSRPSPRNSRRRQFAPR